MSDFKKTMTNYGLRWVLILRSVARRFWIENYMVKASALVYTTLLSLIPIFTVLFSMVLSVKFFHNDHVNVSSTIEQFIFQRIPIEGLQPYFQTFIEKSSKLSGISVIAMLITSLMLLKTIEGAFNQVWYIKKKQHSVVAFLGYWIVLTLLPTLIALAIVLSSTLSILPFFRDHIFLGDMLRWARSSLPTAVELVGFTVLYYMVPNCKVRLRDALLGGVVATILFDLMQVGLVVNLFANFSEFVQIYGQLATVPVFLIWVYLAWLIVLIGALFAYASSVYLNHQVRSRLDGFSHAVLWLGFFWKAQQKGQELSLLELIQKTPALFSVEPSEMLFVLIDSGLLVRTDRGGYVLQRDLSSMSVRGLYELLPWRMPTTEVPHLAAGWEQQAVHQLHEFHEGMAQKLDFPVSRLYS